MKCDRDEDVFERDHNTMGGLSDTELNELTVSPTGSLLMAERVVTTVTPVGKRPKADRK